MNDKSTERDQHVRDVRRTFGSMPWLKVQERKDYRVKIFKSGNSVALRLPAELGLKAGTEMNLRVEGGEIVAVEPVDRPKRKFNAAKVCGSANTLTPISDDDRWFEDRPLAWPAKEEPSS